MTTIRIKPEELEAVAEHVPDAEDACSRARTSLSWELPSLVIEVTGIGSDAIHELKDELVHWLDRYEEKLNEAEELLYRTAAAIRQADQTLADNMKELGLEFLGWYDVQRLFGEYDPVTGERISGWDRLFAGGMLLLTIIPPAKGAGVAGKVGIKGVKAAGNAADVSEWISKTKNVLNVDKIKGALQTIYHQVIKGPITATIRSFKQQWEQLLENVGSVLMGPQLAVEGVGVAPSGRMIGIAEESTSSVRISMNQAVDGVAGKRTSQAVADKVVKTDIDIIAERANKAGLDLTPKTCPYKQLGRKGKKKLEEKVKNRTITKGEWKRLQWNKRFAARRDAGVKAFWQQEKRRIKKGEPTTRNWTEEQKKEILSNKIPTHNGEAIIGHHAYSASKYPHLANRGEIIYPVTAKEHFYRWHGGSYKKSLPGKPYNPTYPEEF